MKLRRSRLDNPYYNKSEPLVICGKGLKPYSKVIYGNCVMDVIKSIFKPVVRLFTKGGIKTAAKSAANIAKSGVTQAVKSVANKETLKRIGKEVGQEALNLALEEGVSSLGDVLKGDASVDKSLGRIKTKGLERGSKLTKKEFDLAKSKVDDIIKEKTRQVKAVAQKGQTRFVSQLDKEIDDMESKLGLVPTENPQMMGLASIGLGYNKKCGKGLKRLGYNGKGHCSCKQMGKGHCSCKKMGKGLRRLGSKKGKGLKRTGQ